MNLELETVIKMVFNWKYFRYETISGYESSLATGWKVAI